MYLYLRRLIASSSCRSVMGSPPREASRGPQELAVTSPVSSRFGMAPDLRVELGEPLMGVGRVRNDRQQLLVAADGEVRATAILRQDREVERRGSLLGLQTERLEVMSLRRVEMAELVLEPPEVDVHGGRFGVAAQGFVIGADR